MISLAIAMHDVYMKLRYIASYVHDVILAKLCRKLVGDEQITEHNR